MVLSGEVIVVSGTLGSSTALWETRTTRRRRRKGRVVALWRCTDTVDGNIDDSRELFEVVHPSAGRGAAWVAWAAKREMDAGGMSINRLNGRPTCCRILVVLHPGRSCTLRTRTPVLRTWYGVRSKNFCLFPLLSSCLPPLNMLALCFLFLPPFPSPSLPQLELLPGPRSSYCSR